MRTLIKATGTCSRLKHERVQWRQHVEQSAVATLFSCGALKLSPREVAAIRKVMAHLHRPDVGGDAEVHAGLEHAAPRPRADRPDFSSELTYPCM